MQQKNLIFTGLIFGALIIGIFLYLAIINKPQVVGSNNSILDVENSFNEKSLKCKAQDNTIVTKVIDGDTVVVLGGEHIRLLNIDADEKNYPCYEAAKGRLEQLVLNKDVVLKKDITDLDKYGRCLRTIFLDNKNIGLELVKEGFAIARFYEPDISYKIEIQNAEKYAIENKVGCKWNINKLKVVN